MIFLAIDEMRPGDVGALCALSQANFFMISSEDSAEEVLLDRAHAQAWEEL